MSFTDAIRTCLGKYATFDGRATRSEFWWFYLFIVIVNVVGYIPFIILSLLGSMDNAIGTLFGVLAILWIIVWIIIWIALLIPNLAVGSRRLHDTGRSGWLQLLLLLAIIPCLGLVGVIVLIVFWAQEGHPGDNGYGPKPA